MYTSAKLNKQALPTLTFILFNFILLIMSRQDLLLPRLKFCKMAIEIYDQNSPETQKKEIKLLKDCYAYFKVRRYNISQSALEMFFNVFFVVRRPKKASKLMTFYTYNHLYMSNNSYE